MTDGGVGRLQQGLPQCELFYKSEEEERKRWRVEEENERRGERESSAISREQSITGSSLKKYYVVQFDKPGLKRQPLLVIVWKANDRSIDLRRLDTAAPVIEINGRLITPPTDEEGHLRASTQLFPATTVSYGRGDRTIVFTHCAE